MNLNDPTLYKPVIFKRTIFYTDSSKTLRDVFMDYTKDGVKPRLGIQEIFLLSHEDYNEMMANNNGVLSRDQIRSKALHSFSVKGYKKKKI